MGDPRVQERDNPLVRRLNAVAQENERLGTALGGGARPPRAPIGPVQGGTATVLPPPAVPLTPEEALGDALPPAEAEELERRWALDPSNPANRTTLVSSPDGAIEEVPIMSPIPISVGDVRKATVSTRPNYLTMIEALPISDEQKQAVKAWVFEGAAKQIMTETARRLDEMQIAFGLAPKEEKSEAVPQVRTGPSSGKVGEEQKQAERPAELLQGVHGAGGSAIQSNRGRKRTKTATKTRTKRSSGSLPITGSTGA